MQPLVIQSTRKAEAEAIYTRERQRTNRERLRAYHVDFYAAYRCRDYRRASEVVQDATTITSDMVRLVRRMREINVRRRTLASGAGFAGASMASPADTEGLHLVYVHPNDDFHNAH